MSTPVEQDYSKEKGLQEDRSVEANPVEVAPLDDPTKSRWERSWPTIACGAGLFSDGYLNGVCTVADATPVVPHTHAICGISP